MVLEFQSACYFLHDDLWKMLVPFDRPHGTLSNGIGFFKKWILFEETLTWCADPSPLDFDI